MSSTKKIIIIIFSVLLVGVLAFSLTWTIINWDKVKELSKGSNLYTYEDVEKSFNDGYNQAKFEKSEYDKRIDEYKSSLSAQKAEIESLKKQNQSLNNRLALLSSSNQDNLNEIARLKSVIADNEKTIDYLNNLVASLQKDLETYKNKLKSLLSEDEVLVTFEWLGSVYSLEIIPKATGVVIDNPQSTDYVTFLNWTIDGQVVDLNTYLFLEDTLVVGDYLQRYKVEFLVDGQSISHQFVEDSSELLVPENPYKEGYSFIGWSIDESSVVDVYSFDIDKNINFYAMFKKIDFSTENDSDNVAKHRLIGASTYVSLTDGYYVSFSFNEESFNIDDVSLFSPHSHYRVVFENVSFPASFVIQDNGNIVISGQVLSSHKDFFLSGVGDGAHREEFYDNDPYFDSHFKEGNFTIILKEKIVDNKLFYEVISSSFPFDYGPDLVAEPGSDYYNDITFDGQVPSANINDSYVMNFGEIFEGLICPLELTYDDHIYSDYSVVVEPTCEKNGVERAVCQLCDTFIERDIQASHAWSDWVITQQTTCSSNGRHSRSCLKCGEIENKIYESAFGHDIQVLYKSSTCYDRGYEKKVCSRCDYVHTDILPLSHNLIDGVCSICGASESLDLFMSQVSQEDFIYSEEKVSTLQLVSQFDLNNCNGLYISNYSDLNLVDNVLSFSRGYFSYIVNSTSESQSVYYDDVLYEFYSNGDMRLSVTMSDVEYVSYFKFLGNRVKSTNYENFSAYCLVYSELSDSSQLDFDFDQFVGSYFELSKKI